MFCIFNVFLKELKIKKFTFNAFISKSLIYFSHQVDFNIAFKKIKKTKYLNKETKSTKNK